MEKLYKIEENYAEIFLERELYPLLAVQKAISNFLETTFVKISTKNNKIIIHMVLQKNIEDLDTIVGNFYNELLRETLRYNISKETKHLRELIVGRALYSTCIDAQDESEVLDENDNQKSDEYKENYNIDDIAVNWFENKEENLC